METHHYWTKWRCLLKEKVLQIVSLNKVGNLLLEEEVLPRDLEVRLKWQRATVGMWEVLGSNPIWGKGGGWWKGRKMRSVTYGKRSCSFKSIWKSKTKTIFFLKNKRTPTLPAIFLHIPHNVLITSILISCKQKAWDLHPLSIGCILPCETYRCKESVELHASSRRSLPLMFFSFLPSPFWIICWRGHFLSSVIHLEHPSILMKILLRTGVIGMYVRKMHITNYKYVLIV